MYPWTTWSCDELEDHTIEELMLVPEYLDDVHAWVENSYLLVRET